MGKKEGILRVIPGDLLIFLTMLIFGGYPPFLVSPLRAAPLVFLRLGHGLDARHERGDAVVQRDEYGLFHRRVAPGGEEVAGLSRRHLPPLHGARPRPDPAALEITYG